MLRVLRFATFISCILGTAGAASSKDADDSAIRLMKVASRLLAASTIFPPGTIQVQSPEFARMSDGSAEFRKISDCIYAVYSTEKSDRRFYETLDFTGLTGRYQFYDQMSVHRLILEGRNPRTRCFMFSQSQKGCDYDFRITGIAPSEVRMTLDYISYVQSHGCPQEMPAP